MLDAMIGRGDPCRSPQVLMSAAQHRVGDLLRKPMTTIEGPMHFSAQIAGSILQREAVKILGTRHREWYAEALREPSRESDMIGMIVRHDHRSEALPRQGSAQHRLPGDPA